MGPQLARCQSQGCVVLPELCYLAVQGAFVIEQAVTLSPQLGHLARQHMMIGLAGVLHMPCHGA